MRILLINGSHRKGNTDIAIRKIKEKVLNNSCEVKELLLRDIEIELPDGCEVCAESGICPNIHDQFSEKIEPALRNYDIYIIATPTWDDGVTPLTKIFWDRIVSWNHKDRLYLKNKKIAIVTHGMAEQKSWDNVINWVKSICEWEEAKFGGSLVFKSGSKIGDVNINEERIKMFIVKLLND